MEKITKDEIIVICDKWLGTRPKRSSIQNSCGSCSHTDNDLGMFSLRCDLLHKKREATDWGKVRSWDKCHFKKSKWNPQKQ